MDEKDNKVPTKEDLRQILSQDGTLSRMRASIFSAALTSIRLRGGTNIFSPSYTYKRLEMEDKTLLMNSLYMVREFLTYSGLTFTAECLAAETGMVAALPVRDRLQEYYVLEDTTRPVLCEVLSERKATLISKAVSHVTVPSLLSPVLCDTVEIRPKQNENSDNTKYHIAHWTGLSFWRHCQIEDQQLNLEYLQNCKVFVLDCIDSMNIDDCLGCHIVVAACEGSFFARGCKNCTFTVACKQLRTRDCEDCKICLFTPTEPVIEASTNMIFKPYNAKLPNLKASFKKAGFDASNNKFASVYDFSETDEKYPKPHFVAYTEDHGLSMVSYCRERGKPEAPQEIVQAVCCKAPPDPKLSDLSIIRNGVVISGQSPEKCSSPSPTTFTQFGTSVANVLLPNRTVFELPKDGSMEDAHVNTGISSEDSEDEPLPQPTPLKRQEDDVGLPETGKNNGENTSITKLKAQAKNVSNAQNDIVSSVSDYSDRSSDDENNTKMDISEDEDTF